MAYRSMGELIDEETYRVLELLNPENFHLHKLLFEFGTYMDEFMMEMEDEFLYIKLKEPDTMTDLLFFLQREAHIIPVSITNTECHIPYSLTVDVPWMRELPDYIAHFFYKRYI